MAAQEYATRSDMTKLGLPSASLDRADTKVAGTVTANLAAANARAAAALAQRTTLPLTAWDTDLTEIVCSLAAFPIMCVLGFNPEDPADNAVRVRYLDAVRRLDLIARGELDLAGVVDATPDTDEGGSVLVTNTSRGWSRSYTR